MKIGHIETSTTFQVFLPGSSLCDCMKTFQKESFFEILVRKSSKDFEQLAIPHFISKLSSFSNYPLIQLFKKLFFIFLEHFMLVDLLNLVFPDIEL